VGLHHIGQGFQGYFCFEEITSFAKIYISNLGIVTVFRFKVWLMFELGSDLSFCWKLLG
jgi:hypothetical protein